MKTVKIASGRVLDCLPAEEPCLGAVFTSYSFDPAFFENQVLRSVFRLTSDPDEQAERYHQEARRTLQETPVVAIVDAAERRPGRRLPFDLLEVANIVFHAKSVLLLYRDFARLLIGSGNLTFDGYGGNTELFFVVDLAYSISADAAVLALLKDHLGRIRDIVRQPGTQLDLFLGELQRRMPPVDPVHGDANFAFLDSTAGPLIDQFASLLPDNAVVESIGMLAPFFERDGATELDLQSVFGALASRAAKDAVLDVGVSWEKPEVYATGGSEIKQGLGRLWTWAYERDGISVLEHLVPVSIGPKTIRYIDESGRRRRWSLEDVLEAIEGGSLWMQPRPTAFAPRRAVALAENHFSELRLWLHPTSRLLEGRVVHRPLHAKLLVMGYRTGRLRRTLVLMGSPNMSRRALLMQAGIGRGNVEVAVAFRLNSSVSLRKLVPELIYAPASAVDLQERSFPELGDNFALAIDEAIHDPVAGTLCISWSPEASSLPPWILSYDGKKLDGSEKPPGYPVTIEDFALKPASAEVVLHVDEREYSIPILVTDLIALPASASGPSLGLDELLMLLGQRIGSERALQIAERRVAVSGASNKVNKFFDEGFSPTDVFRAWWSVAEALQHSDLSIQAFRLRLEGALGVGAAWRCMLEAGADQLMSTEELWFYGAELLRALREVDTPPEGGRDEKNRLLDAFCAQIRRDLGKIGLPKTRPWMEQILAFYKDAEA